jgi:small subunit ribosomal protein S16
VNKSVDWLQKGAQPTTTVNAILRYKGVLYKKHLLRGLKKGAFAMEEVDRRFDEWMRTHENSVLDHVKNLEAKKTQTRESEIARITAKREEKAKASRKAFEEAAAMEQETTEAAVPEQETTEAAATDAVTEETTDTQTDLQ